MELLGIKATIRGVCVWEVYQRKVVCSSPDIIMSRICEAIRNIIFHKLKVTTVLPGQHRRVSSNVGALMLKVKVNLNAKHLFRKLSANANRNAVARIWSQQFP